MPDSEKDSATGQGGNDEEDIELKQANANLKSVMELVKLK